MNHEQLVVWLLKIKACERARAWVRDCGLNAQVAWVSCTTPEWLARAMWKLDAPQQLQLAGVLAVLRWARGYATDDLSPLCENALRHLTEYPNNLGLIDWGALGYELQEEKRGRETACTRHLYNALSLACYAVGEDARFNEEAVTSLLLWVQDNPCFEASAPSSEAACCNAYRTAVPWTAIEQLLREKGLT